MKNKFKELFKKIDYFGVSFNFHYKSKEKYFSLSGGIMFFIFLLLAIVFVIINFISLIKRENMSVISYKMPTPSTDTISFNNYSLQHAFGVKCSGSTSNLINETDYFNIEVNQVKLTQSNGKVNYEKKPINYSYCTKDHFYNKFDQSVESYGLNQRFCFDDDITIRGLYSEEIYQYVELTVSMSKTNISDFESYYNLLTLNDCTFQLYHIDYGIDINDFSNPIKLYLRQEFLKLSPIDYNKMEIYYFTEKFMSDKNYLINNYHINYFAGFSMFSSFSLYKGKDRFEKRPDDFDKLAKFFLRADTGRYVIIRKYMKFTEFLANVSSLIAGIYYILFALMGRINKFYSKEKIMTKLFKFKDDKNEFFIKKLKQNLPEENNSKLFSPTPQKAKLLSNNNNLKLNKLSIKLNSHTNKESFTTEELINNNNNNLLISNYLSHTHLGNNNDDNKKKILFQNSFTSSNFQEKIRFKYNFCEILVFLFFPFLFFRKLNYKNNLYQKGELKLYLSTDILSYIKKMQMLDILIYILLDPNQIEMINFLSRPVISSKKENTVIPNSIKINIDNADNNNTENEINDFCKGYKKIKSSLKKTTIDQKLYNIVNVELDNLFG